jgi:hypothetical protein
MAAINVVMRVDYMGDEAKSHYNGDTHHFYIGKIDEAY